MTGAATAATTTAATTAATAATTTAATTAATAATTTAATTAATDTTAAAAATATVDPNAWVTGITDEATRTWVTAKGFKDPGAVATSAFHLEKLTGAGLDRLVQIPKDSTPEAWNAVYDKLGRPAKADLYSIPVPEGDKGEFAGVAKTWFHEAGLNQSQAEKVAVKWNEFQAAQAKAAADADAAKSAEQVAALSKEWGAAIDQNKGIAKQAATALGVTGEQIDALQKVMGYDATMKFFHAIGSKTGEGEFLNGGNTATNGVMTPAQAAAEIKLLRGDAGFTSRYLKGDVEARQKMEHLHKMAYPES